MRYRTGRNPGGVRRELSHGSLVAAVGVDHHRLDAAHDLAEHLETGDQRLVRPSRMRSHRRDVIPDSRDPDPTA